MLVAISAKMVIFVYLLLHEKSNIARTGTKEVFHFYIIYVFVFYMLFCKDWYRKANLVQGLGTMVIKELYSFYSSFPFSGKISCTEICTGLDFVVVEELHRMRDVARQPISSKNYLIEISRMASWEKEIDVFSAL